MACGDMERQDPLASVAQAAMASAQPLGCPLVLSFLRGAPRPSGPAEGGHGVGGPLPAGLTQP